MRGVRVQRQIRLQVHRHLLLFRVSGTGVKWMMVCLVLPFLMRVSGEDRENGLIWRMEDLLSFAFFLASYSCPRLLASFCARHLLVVAFACGWLGLKHEMRGKG